MTRRNCNYLYHRYFKRLVLLEVFRAGCDTFFSISDADFRHRFKKSTSDTFDSDTFWRHRKKNRFSRAKFQQIKPRFLNVNLKEAKS